MTTDPAELDAGRALAQSLQLEPLALEGGRFRRTFTGGGISAILYMLIGSDFSAMHRLGSDEVYFHHQGAPLRLLLIEPTGTAHEVANATASTVLADRMCHRRRIGRAMGDVTSRPSP